jgi:D-glycero-D-manno-heptose 1,7-bisphosphate phosphatase
MKKNAVFLDKDGTLIENVPFSVETDRIRLTDGAGQALSELHKHGFELLLISNQPGIALGYFSADEVWHAFDRIQELLESHDVQLDGFYFCPHHPDGSHPHFSRSCVCRKPENGLLLYAAFERSIDLSSSWMIGDILDDIEAGNTSGCHSILIDNGNETEWKPGPYRTPFSKAPDLPAAAQVILSAVHE